MREYLLKSFFYLKFLKMEAVATIDQPKTMVLNWSQMHTLLETPNIERRIYRDIKDVLRVAYSKENPDQLLFLLHNDKERMEAGTFMVEILKPIDNEE